MTVSGQVYLLGAVPKSNRSYRLLAMRPGHCANHQHGPIYHIQAFDDNHQAFDDDLDDIQSPDLDAGRRGQRGLPGCSVGSVWWQWLDRLHHLCLAFYLQVLE